MSSALIKAITPRRSVYALSKENFPLSNDEVVSIVRQVVSVTPTSFNTQTTRALVLFGANHDKLWNDIATPALKAAVSAEVFENMSGKLKAFAGAYGTVLFFEDTDAIKAIQEKFPLYAANFPIWAAQSSGASQINVWSALALDGVGANLQHYSPLVDEEVSKTFNVPSNWKLTAQLVFGTKVGEPVNKTTLSPEETVKVAE